jgi:uncharacterized protein
MWIVELTLADTLERTAARPAHRASLTHLYDQGVVRMAGPTHDDSAAFIILDLPDRGAVDAFLAADPYFATPGVVVLRVVEYLPFLP